MHSCVCAFVRFGVCVCVCVPFLFVYMYCLFVRANVCFMYVCVGRCCACRENKDREEGREGKLCLERERTRVTAAAVAVRPCLERG